jgi:transcriptional regulator with XRE-family HTH domain
MTRRRRRPPLPPDEHDHSPLRLARLAKGNGTTLEQVCADLDQRSETGSSGVTPGMLSGWELGKHVTSPRYRAMLAAYYKQTAERLFAHQDLALAEDSDIPRLLLSHRELHHAMLAVVEGAHHYLAVTGSRSRDTAYLHAIETALAQRPSLVHYRILFGPPRHRTLTEHLLRLVELRNPEDRSLGIKTLHISMIDTDIPERFFAANDTAAVVPIPSLTALDGFDCGVILGTPGARLIDHARQLYAAGRKLETVAALEQLTSL